MKMKILLALVSLLVSAAPGSAHAADKFDLLLVGDSHTVGTFGHALDDLLRTVPASSVRTYASCGSATWSWYSGWRTTCGYFEKTIVGGKAHVVTATKYPTPYLSKLLAAPAQEGATRVTIVALGSNSIGDAKVGAEIERMATDIRKSGSRCIWIGPPNMRKFGGRRIAQFYSRLAAALKAPGEPLCDAIDSRKYTAYPATGGDGVHYYFPGGKEIARKWAEGVFGEIQQALKAY